MKSLKFAPIAIALFYSFGSHLMMSYDFFYWSSYRKFFPTCLLLTGIYFILFLFTLGFFIIEPYKKLNEDIENKKHPTNWFWYIYLSGWIVPCFAFVEFEILDILPIPIGRYFFDAALMFFFIKGIFLIPALLFYVNLSEKKPISPIGYQCAFIEIIIVILFVFALSVLGEMGNFDL